MMGPLQMHKRSKSNGDGAAGDELSQDPGYAEVDPTGRYGRYNEVLGKGSSKTVYRAFDEHRGMEVAWNKVQLHDFLRTPGDLERLYGEIHLLKSLRHRSIMRLHASWLSTPTRSVNFVTELFTSGTLRHYLRRHPRAGGGAGAVRRWCRQVLAGLTYLHARGVVHRDLKCDNLFVNGNQGVVKIGDFGLATVVGGGGVRCVVGTPEFMAPEVYAEEYDERADVYSFGMCVLEMVTMEYPYSECVHPVHIYKKVTSGIKPAALYRVKDAAVRRFIERCLAPAARRPSAAELLADPFLVTMEDGGGELGCYYGGGEDADYYRDMYNYLHQPACLDYHHGHHGGSNGSTASNGDQGNDSEDDQGSVYHGIDELFNAHDDDDDEVHAAGVDVSIRGKRMEDGRIFLRLRIADKDGTGRVRNIYFPFDADADTALSVATEMVAELDITDHDVTRIAGMIDGEVAALLPHWTPGPATTMNDDDGGEQDNATGRCKNCRRRSSGESASSSGGSSLDDYMSAAAAAAAARRGGGCRCAAEMHGRFEEITFQQGEEEEEQVRFQSSGCSSDDGGGGGGQAEQCSAGDGGDGDGGKLEGSHGVAQDGGGDTDTQRSDLP